LPVCFLTSPKVCVRAIGWMWPKPSCTRSRLSPESPHQRSVPYPKVLVGRRTPRVAYVRGCLDTAFPSVLHLVWPKPDEASHRWLPTESATTEVACGRGHGHCGADLRRSARPKSNLALKLHPRLFRPASFPRRSADPHRAFRTVGRLPRRPSRNVVITQDTQREVEAPSMRFVSFRRK
jgi:hypothetical protein